MNGLVLSHFTFVLYAVLKRDSNTADIALTNRMAYARCSRTIYASWRCVDIGRWIGCRPEAPSERRVSLVSKLEVSLAMALVGGGCVFA